MLATLLDELGISGWTLELNSVGSSADRARYNDALRAALVPVVSQMCADCQRRASPTHCACWTAKFRDQPIIETLPVIADSLDEASRVHFAAVMRLWTRPACRTRATTVWCADWTTTRVRPSSSLTRLGARTRCSARPLRRPERDAGRTQGSRHRLCHGRGPAGSHLLAALDQNAATLKAEAYIAPLDEGLNADALVLAANCAIRASGSSWRRRLSPQKIL